MGRTKSVKTSELEETKVPTKKAKKEKEVELSLVDRILESQNLEDDAKLRKFFKREVIKSESLIRILEANKQSIYIVYDSATADLKDKIEDAKACIKDAECKVDATQIANNECMDSFAREYWSVISYAMRTVDNLMKCMEELTLKYWADIGEIEVKIRKYQDRIALCES